MSETTNVYLEEKLNKLGINGLVVDITELNSLHNNTNYIINLGNNTHWVALYVNDNIVIYSDSFGVVPPLRILKLVKKYANEIVSPVQFHHNTKEIQNLNSGYCGLYALLFLLIMNKKKTKIMNRLEFYQDLFCDNHEKNLTKLKKYLHKYNIIN